MTYAEVLEQVNIALDDTDNFTFTPEEKQRALDSAFKDKYVTKKVYDSSTTYSQSTLVYALPATITTVNNIEYLYSTYAPEPVGGDGWDVIDGYIHINKGYQYVIPNSSSLGIRGHYKYTTSDTITESNMEEYVITLARYNTLGLLGNKKVNRFIKNDATMNEIIAMRRELQDDIREMRQEFARSYERI